MFDKVKAFAKQHGGKIVGALTGVGVTAGTAVSAYAVDSTAMSEAQSGIQTIMNSITGTLTIGNIATIIATGMGAVIGIFLAWWGARKLVHMLMSAFKKGRVAL